MNILCFFNKNSNIFLSSFLFPWFYLSLPLSIFFSILFCLFSGEIFGCFVSVSPRERSHTENLLFMFNVLTARRIENLQFVSHESKGERNG